MLLTGKIGDVMQESAKAALSWIRAHTQQLGLPERRLNETDLHVHFPAGATPKDGPSAGVTIATALVSLFTDRLVRPDVAMTGGEHGRPSFCIVACCLRLHLNPCFDPGRNAVRGRDIFAWVGLAGRRHQGKGDRSAPCWCSYCHPAREEREGSR
jgi:hypothetical protein